MLETRSDQATGLRRMFGRDAIQVMSVAAGGSRAPTLVTLNLAAALARLGHRLLLVDLSMGEAAAGVGLRARYDLAHAIDGDRTIEQVVLRSSEGFSILPASRGVARLAGRSHGWHRLLSAMLPAEPAFNVWLVNGVAPPAESDSDGSPLMVIGLTRDAITEAYAQIKSLVQRQGQREFRVVMDRADSEGIARTAYGSIAETARRFLSARLDYCGFLPRDEAASSHGIGVRVNAAERVPLTDARSPRGYAFARLAETVAEALPVDLTSFALNH
jgi:flagellar biosynthesis protein FlhG